MNIKPLLFASLMLVCTSINAQVLDCEVDGKSVNPSNGNTTAGVTGMMRCVERDSQLLRREQQLQNGKFMGLERFYEKGKLTRENQINERGNKEGIGKIFSASGQLITEEQYRKGSSFGLQKSFYESGAIKRLTYYDLSPSSPTDQNFIHTQEVASIDYTENGKLSGIQCGKTPFIRYERIDDRLLCGFAGESKLSLYSRDTVSENRTIRNGVVIERTGYWENGKPRFEYAVRDGKAYERTFNNSGGQIKEIVSTVLERGRTREIERDFHSSGQMVSEKRWAEGQLINEASWYLNGQPKTVVAYQNKGQEILRRDHHDNGQKASEGTFVRERYNQRPIGEHMSYDTTGRLRGQSSYDEKGRINREREWDENGKPTRDEAVFEDGSRKAYAR